MMLYYPVYNMNYESLRSFCSYTEDLLDADEENMMFKVGRRYQRVKVKKGWGRKRRM
jgi:hypothetical protein